MREKWTSFYIKAVEIFTHTVITHYKFTVAIVLIITAPFLYFFTQQSHSNKPEIYFNQNDPDWLAYKEFQRIYGNEQIVSIVINEKNIFTPASMHLIGELTAGIKEIQGVQRIFSITDTEEPKTSGDKIEFKKIIPDGELTQEQMDAVRKKVLGNPALVNSLVSADGTTTAVLIEIKELNKDERHALARSILSTSKRINNNRARLYYSGGIFLESEFNDLTKKDFSLFTPVIFFTIFLIIILMLRNFTLSVICQFNIFLCLIWCMGFFISCGETLNIVTIIMGPVILAISVSDSVHILSHYRERFINAGGGHIDAVEYLFEYLWLPCLLTSLTTAVGFFSFITGTLRPIRVVGIFTSLGVVFAFILTFTFLPAVIILLRERITSSIMKPLKRTPSGPVASQSVFTKAVNGIGRFSTTNHKGIFLVFVIIMSFSIAGIFMIKFETNIIDYLPDSNSFKSDTEFIEEHLGGTNPFIILIKAKEGKDFTYPESVRLLDTIEKDIMHRIKKFSSSASVVELIKQMNRAFNNGKDVYYRVPDTQEDIEEFYEMVEARVLDRILGPGYKEARITFNSRLVSNENGRHIMNVIDKYLKEKTKGTSYGYEITGRIKLALSIEKSLKESQIRSFLSAFLIIFIMMYFVCGTWGLTLLSVFPNIFPIILTIGIMGWAGIPMDISTVMIASITIGIAVDDTIHIVVAYRRNMAVITDRKAALYKCYEDVGKPVVMTSVILFIGFFILIFGQIIPTRTFGVLTACAMFFALIGDMFILPSLLLIFKPCIKPIHDAKNNNSQ